MSEGTELYFLRSCFLLFIFHSGLVLYFCIFLCLLGGGRGQTGGEGGKQVEGR